jgi:hypothetical protein
MERVGRTPAQYAGGLRWSLRARWSEHQSYLRFSRRRHPLGVVTSETELVIEAYMRSANTFSTVAFQTSQVRPVRLAHHLHAPAQIIAAARMGIPVLVPVRAPRDAAISVTIRSPQVSLRQALDAHRRFHEAILPYRESCHIAPFEQVTSDLGAVIAALNDRFSTDFTPFDHTPENVQSVYDLIDERARHPAYSDAIRAYVSGVISREDLEAARTRSAGSGKPSHLPEHRVARPSESRQRLQALIAERYMEPDLAPLRERADTAFHRIAFGD